MCSGLQNGLFRVVERAVLAPETCRIAAQKGLLGGAAWLMVEIDDTNAFFGVLRICTYAHIADALKKANPCLVHLYNGGAGPALKSLNSGFMQCELGRDVPASPLPS